MDSRSGSVLQEWISRALLTGLLAGACQAGVFTEWGDHPNTDVQLPAFRYLNFTLSSATLDREFPQYNYTEQGDLVGYFAYNPARLIIWAPRATGQIDQEPPVSALLQLTAPLLVPQTLPLAAANVTLAIPIIHAVNYHLANESFITREHKPPEVLHELAAPPPLLLPAVHTESVMNPHTSAIPEPSLTLLVGIAIAVAAAVQSKRLYQLVPSTVFSPSQSPEQRAAPRSNAAGSNSTRLRL